MAFRQPVPIPRQLYVSQPDQEESSSISFIPLGDRAEESQEWVLFSPSQATSSTSAVQPDRTTHTAGLSRISDFGSIATRSGQVAQSNVDHSVTEDGELDSLDEGLQAFGEPSRCRASSYQGHAAVLPTHDGLGTFPTSSAPVQDQLWQHERYNPKRKHEANHPRRPSVQRRLDAVEELDLQTREEKRLRIEQWRMEQSQALLKEVENETRRRKQPRFDTTGLSRTTDVETGNDRLEPTPNHDDVSSPLVQETAEAEPFWRRLTRTFIRDVIGIDEPLLSVIVGETLLEDMYAIADLATDSEGGRSAHQRSLTEESWPDRLLQRVARELGLHFNKLSPHPGALTVAASSVPLDYAGMAVSAWSPGKLELLQRPNDESSSKAAPLFAPTMQDSSYAASWGLEDETSRNPNGAIVGADDSDRLRREREYWERELDIKMVFRFLKSRFSSRAGARRQDTSEQPATTTEDPIRRADVIRRHHPLVAKARQPRLVRLRRESTLRSSKLSTSSCATESLRGGHKASQAMSGGSSRNYWDIGGSIRSGSAIASVGVMGTWGEA